MKWLEHRRHAHRTKPSPHINREGVATARRIGERAGPFARVITSPKKRAAETAVAMGFAIDAEADELLDRSKDIPELDAGTFEFAGLHAKLAKAMRPGTKSEKYLRDLRALLVDELERVPDGERVLMVSHGGVVEWSALVALGEEARLLGPAVETCEGIELGYENGEFRSVRALRLA